ncbi:hypothetical protein DYB37_008080 [Aphanomyces astaci]|uniref:Uncharacterized protein n=1 Tax=Aphanomyces astaci TaxID=112090 RepID=A0A418EUL9_APHAT|nr:hypothetical protein DYB37_008080 [Aphanomyces astaci]
MATVIVHRNGVPTAIQVPATGIIRQPHPSSSENDSSDTTDSPVDPPLTARQLRSKRAADTFLARHDRTRNPRSAPRTRHTHMKPRPTRPDTPSSAPDGLSEDDRPIPLQVGERFLYTELPTGHMAAIPSYHPSAPSHHPPHPHFIHHCTHFSTHYTLPWASTGNHSCHPNPWDQPLTPNLP